MLPAIETALADIETTAIKYDVGGVMIIPDKVHLITVKDHERQEVHVFGPGEDSLREGVDLLERSKLVVFHNGIGFDKKVLIKHFNFKVRDEWHVIDSLLLCQLFYSNVKEEEDYARRDKHLKLPDSPTKFTGDLIGSHSLEAWGLRLKTPVPKMDYVGLMKKLGVEDPWAEYSKEMEVYAIQDVVTLDAIWTERLKERFNARQNRNAIYVEHQIAELMEDLKESGIKFDRIHAEEFAEDLEYRSELVAEKIQEEFPPRFEPVKWVHREIPIDFPDLDDETLLEYIRVKNSKEPEDIARAEEIMNTSGPRQRLTPLMYEHRKNVVYRPRHNLPAGYLREQWGDVFTPKVNRAVKNKAGEILYHAVKGSPYVKCDRIPLNPGSRPQIARRLMEFGWIPEEFTDKGNPSLSEVELLKIEEQFPIASSLVKYLLIQKRLGAVKTGDKAWLNLLDHDDFIHPTIRSCNTVTFRASHSDPNISQVTSVKMRDVLNEDGSKTYKTVPKNRYDFVDNKWVITPVGTEEKVIQAPRLGEDGKWGWESRMCFTVPDGFKFIGADLAGIEMRAWAHYLWRYDGGKFADIVLNKDVHEENRIILGFDDRRKAKEWLYACVPMDTQALTKEGWKTYDQLRVGELIMTYNPETKEKEWQPLLELVKYDDAEIMEISHTAGFNVRCTPNHRWFTRRRTGGKKGKYYVDEVVTAEDITTEHAIIQNAPLAKSCYEGVGFSMRSPKYGTDWVKEVINASHDSRTSFLQGFLLADGYHEQDGSWAWTQLKGDIAEGLLTCSYLVWDRALRVVDILTAKNPMIRVRHSKKNFVTGQRLCKRMIDNAPVWCPRTANGSWVMRQGNTITITGNTMYGGGDPKLGFIIDPLATVEKQKALGTNSRARFMAGLRGYEELNNELMLGVRRGYLKGLDGRRCPVRKQHAALNTLLQSCGAIIAKYWTIFTMDIIENEHKLKWGYDKDFTLMIWSHDELDFAARPEFEEPIIHAATEGAKRAEQFLQFRLPVEIGINVGQHWGEAH